MDDLTNFWVAVMRSLEGNFVVRSLAELGHYAETTRFHVVVTRTSAIYGSADSPSLDGSPDSDDVAHWFDANHIHTRTNLRLRFAQAEAMAEGLNAWETQTPMESHLQEPCPSCYDPDTHSTCTCVRPCREPWCARR